MFLVRNHLFKTISYKLNSLFVKAGRYRKTSAFFYFETLITINVHVCRDRIQSNLFFSFSYSRAIYFWAYNTAKTNVNASLPKANRDTPFVHVTSAAMAGKNK